MAIGLDWKVGYLFCGISSFMHIWILSLMIFKLDLLLKMLPLFIYYVRI